MSISCLTNDGFIVCGGVLARLLRLDQIANCQPAICNTTAYYFHEVKTLSACSTTCGVVLSCGDYLHAKVLSFSNPLTANNIALWKKARSENTAHTPHSAVAI